MIEELTWRRLVVLVRLWLRVQWVVVVRPRVITARPLPKDWPAGGRKVGHQWL